MDQVGQEVSRIRQERGLSQGQLAKNSGVDRATLNQVEGGRRSPTIDTLEKLASALAVEVADFFPRAQPDLFAAAGIGQAPVAQHYPDTEAPPLELAVLYDASPADRKQALEAATADEVVHYMADLDRALENARRTKQEEEHEPTREQLVEYAARLGRLQSEAEIFGQAAHAGVGARIA